ncbi:MAG: B12-binding domain-containing radical SAM protein [Firmicutes bacterium]|nr:B12-binding domain-containing radical SAM protein [Bacillota bacterium]
MKKPFTLLVKYHQNANIRPIPEEAEETLQVYPSLGIGYIASYLRKNGYPVDILDAHALKLSPDDYRQKVASTGADIVGITSTTVGWPGAVEAAKLAREALPNALIIAGGPHLSVYPEESLSFPFIDMAAIGDGEETMLEIVRKMEKGEPVDDIAGTAVKANGVFKMNQPRDYIKDLSMLPHPAVDMLPLDRYKCLTLEYPFFTMVSSRGCPYKCGFCSQVYCGDRVRFRTPEDVVSEIETYVKQYGAREIVMFDETFTLNENRVLKICSLIKEKKLKFRWNIRTRVDTITEAMMIALKETGCYGLHMGVESGDPDILEIMQKGITLEQVRWAFKTARKHNFITRGYFMIGYLDETPDTYKATVDIARELDLDWASFSITTPLPATPLFDESVRRGYIDPDFWKKYTLLQASKKDFPHVPSKHWDEKKLSDMMRDAYFKFYLRPGYALRRLTTIRSWKQFTDLFRGLKIIFLMKD